MPRKRAILVFVRHPTPGRVKSRLAAGIGHDAATRFYRCCAECIISECTRVGETDVFVCYSDEEEREKVTRWLQAMGPSISLQPQKQVVDLGERMISAFKDTFENNAYDSAMIVGSDIPDLKAAVMERGFEALENFDVAFGPAEDGGYYLIGLRSNALSNDLFRDIHWSTSSVLHQSCANAVDVGLTVAPKMMLPTLQDIDTKDDLLVWLERASLNADESTETLCLAGKEALCHAQAP